MKKQITFGGFIEIGIILTSLLSIISSYFHQVRLFELTSHFKLQYLIASIILLIFYTFKKRKFAAIWFLALSIYNISFIVPWYLSATPNAAKSLQELKILHFNVYTANENYEQLVRLINEQSPDLISLQEVNQWWLNGINEIKKTYPYQVEIPRNDNFGIALYSKFPIVAHAELTESQFDVPTISAKIKLTDTVLHLITTHPLPPISNSYFKKRNKQLQFIAMQCAKLDKPTILIGDLNVSMWSQNYQKFEKISKLSNSRKGFGIWPTWPSDNLLLQIPIDHCLISPNFKVVDTQSLKNIGSDHLPLFIKLSL